MPLGNVLGEIAGKVTSVRITDLGGGQVRLEIDGTGEAKGQVPGQIYSTMTVEGSRGRPVTYAITGAILATSGAVVQFTGRGVGIRTGEGHKVRYRGSAHYATDDPSLVAFNSLLTAAEFEIDPATGTITGAICEWK
jgi:hypothetical protein